jgi:hypothetical protein
MQQAVPSHLSSIRRITAPVGASRRVTVSVRALLPLVTIVAVLLALTLIAAGAAQWWWGTYVDPGPRPAVARLDLYRQVADLAPLDITIAGSLNAPWRTTADELRRNPALWRMMHLENWNMVPSALREEVLDRMVGRYRPLLMDPRVWDQMTPADWDDVPQPVRTVAYRQMVAYWVGFYDVGGRYGLPRREVRDTLQAIALSESWFDHRAERVDPTGNHDIGLVQASDYARARVRQLAARGDVDVSFTDAEYWNPWKATRFLGLWMSLLIDESGGDLDRAVRAYNRGIANADDAQGQAYLAAVQRRRRRFIENQDAPPAWRWLWSRTLHIESEEWPWLRAR